MTAPYDVACDRLWAIAGNTGRTPCDIPRFA
jgi:hypothetical protein